MECLRCGNRSPVDTLVLLLVMGHRHGKWGTGIPSRCRHGGSPQPQHLVRRGVWTNDGPRSEPHPPSNEESIPCPLSPLSPEGHGNNGLLQVITYINEAAPPSIYRHHDTRAPRDLHHHRHHVSTRPVPHPRRRYRRAGHHQASRPSQTVPHRTCEDTSAPSRHLCNHSASNPTTPSVSPTRPHASLHRSVPLTNGVAPDKIVPCRTSRRCHEHLHVEQPVTPLAPCPERRPPSGPQRAGPPLGSQ